MNARDLLTHATKARENSYSHYSNFMVGAALLTQSGKLYLGCNIENVAFSPSNCAERTAFFKAISEGEQNFTSIAIVGGKKGLPPTQACVPCGVCLQVMSEFCDADKFKVILSDGADNTKTYLLRDLLPHGFNTKL